MQYVQYLALDSSGNVYVTNLNGNAIDVFNAGQSGNVAPTRILRGGATGIDSPDGLAFDSVGHFYVSNFAFGPEPNSIEEFAAGPMVTSASPTSGPTAGGTHVTITGTGFSSGATVTYGGVAATDVDVVSATKITATTPAHAAGAVTLAVTSGGISALDAPDFSYKAALATTGADAAPTLELGYGLLGLGVILMLIRIVALRRRRSVA